MIYLNQHIVRTFGVRNTSGAAADADSLPTCVLVRNGVDDSGVTVTVTRTSLGRYSYSFTVPGSYAIKDSVQVVATATVGTVTDSDAVFSDFVAQDGASGPSGPSAVTLTFHDAAGDPVGLVDFTIVGQGSSRSASNGVSIIGLVDGTYTVVSRPTSGVVFANYTLVVSGTTAATITGTAAATPAGSTNPALCTLYGYQKLNGAPAVNTRVTAKLDGLPLTDGSSVFEKEDHAENTDENGYWEMDLLRGHTYLLTIVKSGINSLSIVIPNQSVYNVENFI